MARVRPDGIIMALVQLDTPWTDAGDNLRHGLRETLVTIVMKEMGVLVLAVDLAGLTRAEMRNSTRQSVVTRENGMVNACWESCMDGHGFVKTYVVKSFHIQSCLFAISIISSSVGSLGGSGSG